MDRRQFLSLSALTCCSAASNAYAVTKSDAKRICDFDIAFITDVHIEQGQVAVGKFAKTIAEIN